MYTVLILCRSLTLAQRGAQQLSRLGCPAGVVRAPQQLSDNGCTWALSLSARFLPLAEPLLRAPGFACGGRIFRVTDGVCEPLAL